MSAAGAAMDDATPPAGGAAVSLADAYAECRRILLASGSNFGQAFRLLPADRRAALDALYAFCRFVDDSVDEAADGTAAIAAWRDEVTAMLAGRPRHPVTVALGDAVRRFGIAAEHLRDIVTGVEMDLTRRRYDTFAELRMYCYHVAAAVGLAALPIFGCRDPRSRRYAEALGIALQLTNILRDVPEDAERGRIYLPREDLDRFGYSERALVTHTRNDAWRALVRHEAARARALYREARVLLPAVDRAALAPAEGMRLVYQRVLARIERNPDAVFGPRIRVPLVEKALCTAAAWAGRWRRGTP